MSSIWRWVSYTDHRTLHSALSPQECKKRIEAQLVSSRWTRPGSPNTGQNLARGWVSEWGFHCRQYRRGFGFGFSPVAQGTFVRVADGTRIDVDIGLDPSTRVRFLYLIALMVIVEVLIAASLAFSQSAPTVTSLLWLLLFPPAFFAMLVWVAFIGQLLSQGQDAWLLRFLKETLDATEVA